jgi:hypothetical protein
MQGLQMVNPPTSPNVVSLLNTHLSHDSDAAWYCDSGIPAKKLKKAIRAYGNGIAPETVLALADGTVFGSAKEGILVTSTMLISGTSDGLFSIPLQSIKQATALGGWPEYSIEVRCQDDSTHKISTTCFDKKRDALIAFLNSFAHETEETADQATRQAPASMPDNPVILPAFQHNTSIRSVNAGMRLMEICPHDGFDDAGVLFDTALAAKNEVPLLKGYCKYVGFNAREVEGIFLITNQRLMLFSIEAPAKIVFVEVTKRLLGSLPVPFLEGVGSFLLFSIPKSIYVALRGGRQKLLTDALSVTEARLMSAQPPLRLVQESRFDSMAQSVSEVSVGTGVWTGILSREFGMSFTPVELTKMLSVPKDLILPEYETLEPFERLLHAVSDALAKQGIGFRVDASQQRLTLFPAAVERQVAA